MRIRFVLSEAFGGLRRNVAMTVATIVTVAISLTMLGVGLVISTEVSSAKGEWYDKVEVTVYLCPQKDYNKASCPSGGVTDDQKSAIQAKINSIPHVEKIYYTSPEQSLQEFKKAGGPTAKFVTSADQMPSMFRIKLEDPKKNFKSLDDQYNVFNQALSNLPGVLLVRDDRKTLEPFFRILNRIQWGSWTVSIVQILASMLLIGNMIRIAAFSRRRETGIMRLVGSSNAYIQLPFLIEAMICGLVGALFSVLGLYTFYELVIKDVEATVTAASGSFAGVSAVWQTIPWLIGAGILLTVVPAFLTLRRYLRV